MANFGLALPVALIEDLDLVLQEDQHRQLTNPGKFVLELIQEAFVKLPIKRTFIPTGPRLKSRGYLTALPESLYFKFSRQMMASLVGSCGPNSLRSSSVNAAVEVTLVTLDAP